MGPRVAIWTRRDIGSGSLEVGRLKQPVSVDHIVCGLRFRADRRIPGLIPIPPSGQTDVRVFLQSLPAWFDRVELDGHQTWPNRARVSSEASGIQAWTLRGDTHQVIIFDDETTVVIDHAAANVWISWPDPLTLEDAATYLLGPVLGLLLWLRNGVCLHASAVVVQNQTIVLLGPAGAGKSTLAAAFVKRGLRALTDDVVFVREDQGAFSVVPSYPQIKLWSDSTAALFGSPDSLPRITPTHPTWDKRSLALPTNGDSQVHRSVSLGAIYVLEGRVDEARAPYVTGLSARDTLTALVRNTYSSRFLALRARARAFEPLVRLASTVYTRSVTPHASLSRLPELCDAILSDVDSLFSSPTLRGNL